MHHRVGGVDEVDPLGFAVGFVFQQLILGLGEEAFKGIQMNVKGGALVHVARTVDVNVATRFGEIFRLVVIDLVSFEEQVAATDHDLTI